DIIVAVGGDGSVNEIARGLINQPCTLAIIPTGSGNGLARHLNIPMNLSKALDRIKAGKAISIDSVQINNEYFFCTAGAGFDAYVGWKFATAKKRGFWSYTKIVMKSILSYQPQPIRIKVGEEEHRFDNPLFATCANANQFGNNVIISPRSVINDGHIRFIEIDKFPLIYYPVFGYYLLTKKLYNFKYYFEVKAKEITIFISNEDIHIDGEPVNLGNVLNIKVIPGSLNVIL
ncbi:MAG: hypothetical protein KDD41_02775, partial [Flavobacteriales bacterium]|nr:hypothetical protein [Flavobacteriales bacterium]